MATLVSSTNLMVVKYGNRASVVRATSKIRQLARLKLLTETYLKMGYIHTEDLGDDGLFVDQFEHIARCYGVFVNEAALVSERLIIGSLEALPIAHLSLDDVGGLHRLCEVTQLVIHESIKSTSNRVGYSLLDLIKHAAHVAIQLEVDHIAAVVNKVLYQKLVLLLGQNIRLIGSPQSLSRAPYRDDEPLYPVVAPTTALLMGG